MEDHGLLALKKLLTSKVMSEVNMRMLWLLLLTSSCFLLSGQQSSNCQESKATPQANTSENCPRETEKQNPSPGYEDFGKANGSWNDPERALNYYNSALAKGYDTVELCIQLGRLLTKLKRYEEAYEQFRIAIDRDNNSRAHDALAKALLANKRYEEALKELEIVQKLDPDSNAIGLFDLDVATALDGLGRYEEALKFYQSYLKNDYGSKPERDKLNERIEEIKKLLGITLV